MDEDTYTTAEAARILRFSQRRITQMLERGELEGEKDNSGRWRISQRAVHDMLPNRPPRDRDREMRRLFGDAGGPSPETSEDAAQEAAELRSRVEDLQYRLGRAEARIELEEVADSTRREERERLIADLERERERADRLAEELREARRSWWRRWFGSG